MIDQAARFVDNEEGEDCPKIEMLIGVPFSVGGA